MKLGKLTNDEIKQWKAALHASRNPQNPQTSIMDVVVKSSRSYLDVAVLREIWNSWELDAIFDNVGKRKNRDQPLSAVAAALTINRCIDPSSKSRVPFLV